MPAGVLTYDLVRKSSADDRRVVQGADNHLTLSFTNALADDWTGFAARAHLRPDYKNYSANYVARWTATITQAEPGMNKVIELALPASETVSVVDEYGRWDVEIYNGTLVKRVVQGRWEMSLEATSE